MRNLIIITYKLKKIFYIIFLLQKKYILIANLRHFLIVSTGLHLESNFIKSIFHLAIIYNFLICLTLLVRNGFLCALQSCLVPWSSFFLFLFCITFLWENNQLHLNKNSILQSSFLLCSSFLLWKSSNKACLDIFT